MDTSRLMPLSAAIVFAGLPPHAGAEGAAPPDKGSYTLLNPTPRELMRELSTDRPDTTESPYTVDAGHIQLELSFFEYAREDDGPTTDTFAVAPFNAKVGLLNNADLQFVITPYTREETDGAGTACGVSDAQLRLKINLWGNDGGGTAMAFMPFISFPTGDDDLSSGRIEGGLIFPFAADLPAGFGLGLMAEVDFIFERGAGEYQVDFVHTATIARDLVGSLGGFVEYAGAENLSIHDGYRATLNTGLTYGIGPDLQLDCGVGLGLTEAAEDLVVFVGLSARY